MLMLSLVVAPGPLALPVVFLDSRIRQRIKCRSEEGAKTVCNRIPIEAINAGWSLLATDEQSEFFKLAKLVLNLAQRHPICFGDSGCVSLAVALDIH